MPAEHRRPGRRAVLNRDYNSRALRARLQQRSCRLRASRAVRTPGLSIRPSSRCGAVPRKMKTNCLFLVNGLGMGNSTRCFAIMEHLHDRGASIHVLTSGNGLEFFQDKKQVTSLSPMASFYYAVSHGRISAWHTVASLRVLAQRAREKRAQLERV